MVPHTMPQSMQENSFQYILNSSNGVTVSTLDFESSDGGSNPPWSYFEISRLVTPIFVKKVDPARTRTWNLRFRRPMPYPLGHRAGLTAEFRIDHNAMVLDAPAPDRRGKKKLKTDSCEIRTHALSDQRLKLAP